MIIIIKCLGGEIGTTISSGEPTEMNVYKRSSKKAIKIPDLKYHNNGNPVENIQEVEYEVCVDWSIGDIKKRIFQISNIIPERQRFIYSGKLVSDETLVMDIDSGQEFTIHLVIANEHNFWKLKMEEYAKKLISDFESKLSVTEDEIKDNEMYIQNLYSRKTELEKINRELESDIDQLNMDIIDFENEKKTWEKERIQFETKINDLEFTIDLGNNANSPDNSQSLAFQIDQAQSQSLFKTNHDISGLGLPTEPHSPLQKFLNQGQEEYMNEPETPSSPSNNIFDKDLQFPTDFDDIPLEDPPKNVYEPMGNYNHEVSDDEISVDQGTSLFNDVNDEPNYGSVEFNGLNEELKKTKYTLKNQSYDDEDESDSASLGSNETQPLLNEEIKEVIDRTMQESINETEVEMDYSDASTEPFEKFYDDNTNSKFREFENFTPKVPDRSNKPMLNGKVNNSFFKNPIETTERLGYNNGSQIDPWVDKNGFEMYDENDEYIDNLNSHMNYSYNENNIKEKFPHLLNDNIFDSDGFNANDIDY